MPWTATKNRKMKAPLAKTATAWATTMSPKRRTRHGRSPNAHRFHDRIEDGGNASDVYDEEQKEKQQRRDFGGENSCGLKGQRSQDREVPTIEKQRVPLQDRDKAHDDHRKSNVAAMINQAEPRRNCSGKFHQMLS